MTAVCILHVEDEPDIREVVEISLGLDPNFVTRSCSSGHEALVLANDWPADIILLDVMMPVMDGPTTLMRLRDNSKTANIPVVFMTACAQASELDRFRSLGIAGVIPKPFNPMTLVESVRAFVRPVDERLDALRTVFLKRVGDDATALMKYRCAITDAKAWAAAMIGIRDIAHGLAGAGGIFGYTEISDAAAAVEHAILAEQGNPGCEVAIARALGQLLMCLETNSAPRMQSYCRINA